MTFYFFCLFFTLLHVWAQVRVTSLAFPLSPIDLRVSSDIPVIFREPSAAITNAKAFYPLPIRAQDVTTEQTISLPLLALVILSTLGVTAYLLWQRHCNKAQHTYDTVEMLPVVAQPTGVETNKYRKGKSILRSKARRLFTRGIDKSYLVSAIGKRFSRKEKRVRWDLFLDQNENGDEDCLPLSQPVLDPTTANLIDISMPSDAHESQLVDIHSPRQSWYKPRDLWDSSLETMESGTSAVLIPISAEDSTFSPSWASMSSLGSSPNPSQAHILSPRSPLSPHSEVDYAQEAASVVSTISATDDSPFLSLPYLSLTEKCIQTSDHTSEIPLVNFSSTTHETLLPAHNLHVEGNVFDVSPHTTLIGPLSSSSPTRFMSLPASPSSAEPIYLDIDQNDGQLTTEPSLLSNKTHNITKAPILSTPPFFVSRPASPAREVQTMELNQGLFSPPLEPKPLLNTAKVSDGSEASKNTPPDSNSLHVTEETELYSVVPDPPSPSSSLLLSPEEFSYENGPDLNAELDSIIPELILDASTSFADPRSQKLEVENNELSVGPPLTAEIQSSAAGEDPDTVVDPEINQDVLLSNHDEYPTADCVQETQDQDMHNSLPDVSTKIAEDDTTGTAELHPDPELPSLLIFVEDSETSDPCMIPLPLTPSESTSEDPCFLPLPATIPAPRESMQIPTPPPSPPILSSPLPTRLHLGNLSPSPLLARRKELLDSPAISSAPKPAWLIRASDAPALGLPASSNKKSDATIVRPATPKAPATPIKRSSSLPGAFEVDDHHPTAATTGDQDVVVEKSVQEPSAITSAIEKTVAIATSTAVAARSDYPRRRNMRSPLDIALAMQLRPALGIGADPAWMVRFLMAMFGWLTLLVGQHGDY